MYTINKRLLNVLARKSQRKSLLGKPRHRCEENNEMSYLYASCVLIRN
jgi:hypothetical protein